MTDIFDLLLYKKYNSDLKNLDDIQLFKHYNKIGKNQMRIYFNPNLFKKDKILIFTTKFGYYISHVLQYLLFKNFILSEIIYEINPNNTNLHIILFSQKVKIFPKNYIIYQLEQKDISKWIDKKYELSILFSNKTWDYSQSNINKFPDIIQKKMSFFPIPIIPYNYLFSENNTENNTENNILFYGSMNNRRKKYLNLLQHKLSPKYFIKIVNVYGKKLLDEILNSKIILNIHFYENAILETCRINEILSCNKLVISEKSNPIDNQNYLLYEDKVIFINNINEMYEKIIYYLDNKNIMDIFLNNNLEKINNNVKDIILPLD